jgi:glycosyltransferase involved in cell wall biosynthesis
MKIALNTTTRPVGFDYARALWASGALQRFVCAFPRRKALDMVELLGEKMVFCDLWQSLFLIANRLGGSSGFARSLSHLAKLALDKCTSRSLGGSDAAIFYSGAGLHTIRACRDRGILSVCQVHHAHVLEQERILKEEATACGIPYSPIYSRAQIERQLEEFENVDLILCPSGSVRESFERARFPSGKLAVVHHGVNLDQQFRPVDRSERTQGPLRILYVGQLHYRKGLRYLRDAMDALDDLNIQCRLVGPDFGLSGLSHRPVSDRFIKIGAKKGAALADEYLKADVFVLPSMEEGFGLVVLEAMLAGLPVVITSAVGAKDHLTDGVEGWVVPPGNSHALAERIRWMANHPSDRLAMGEAAARRAKAAGGWSASAQRLIEVLREKRESMITT